MGIYVFKTEVLLRALHEDAQDPNSSHDFARDLAGFHQADQRVQPPLHVAFLVAGCQHDADRAGERGQ